jgi:hypothetical protein
MRERERERDEVKAELGLLYEEAEVEKAEKAETETEKAVAKRATEIAASIVDHLGQRAYDRLPDWSEWTAAAAVCGFDAWSTRVLARAWIEAAAWQVKVSTLVYEVDQVEVRIPGTSFTRSFEAALYWEARASQVWADRAARSVADPHGYLLSAAWAAAEAE